MIQKLLSKLRIIFITQKYRFDMGMAFMVFVNFTLLIITASDKLKLYFNVGNTGGLLMIGIPLAFFSVWAFGYFLDKTVKMQYHYEQVSAQRSPLWNTLFNKLDILEKEIREIREVQHGKS